MGQRSASVDNYIANSAEFARPILEHIREIVHQTCPNAIETIKWGFPHFEYKGILCSMAAFKNHCSFGFWNGHAMADPQKVFADTGMGEFGKIQHLQDLPPQNILQDYIKEAMKLNEAGVKRPAGKASTGKKELAEPDYFLVALNRNEKARQAYDNFSYSNKKEYVEWITDAKTESTRNKRLSTAIEWMAEGKVRTGNTLNKIFMIKEIEAVIISLFVSSDERHWHKVLDCFAPEVLLDYSSMTGNPASRLSSAAIVESWKTFLPGFKHTHHQLGNFLIHLEGEKAKGFCYGTATHFLESNDNKGDIWVVVGSYDFELTRIHDKWRINSMTFNFKYQDGNTSLPQKARQLAHSQS